MQRYCKVLKVNGCVGLESFVGSVVQCKPASVGEDSVFVNGYPVQTQHATPHAAYPHVYLYPSGWEPGVDEIVHLTEKPKKVKRPYNTPVTKGNWKDLVRQGLLKVGTKVMFGGEKYKVIELESMDYEGYFAVCLKGEGFVDFDNEGEMYIRPAKEKKGKPEGSPVEARVAEQGVEPTHPPAETQPQLIKTHITNDNWDELVDSGRLCRGATVEADEEEYTVVRAFDEHRIRVACPDGCYDDLYIDIEDLPVFLLEESAPQQPSTEHKPPLLISANVLKQYIVSTVVHHCGEAVAVVPYTWHSVRGLRVTREGQPPIFVSEEDMLVSVPLEKGIPLK